jgi:hypothetical protein
MDPASAANTDYRIAANRVDSLDNLSNHQSHYSEGAAMATANMFTRGCDSAAGPTGKLEPDYACANTCEANIPLH